MEQKLSDTLVKAIDRSNPFMQNLQLASRFNKLIDEGGGVDLEDNHEITITENGEIEITPAEGKDGMKKVTATVNVPSGGSATAYAWKTGTAYMYLNVDTAPSDSADIKAINYESAGGVLVVKSLLVEGDTYAKVSDTKFTTSYEDEGQTITTTFTRDSTKDFTLWS